MTSCLAEENIKIQCVENFKSAAEWDNCYGKSIYLNNIKSGYFVKGKLEGNGRYQFADGTYYDAEFKNDLPLRIIKKGEIDTKLKNFDISEAANFFSKNEYREILETIKLLEEQFLKDILNPKYDETLINKARKEYLKLLDTLKNNNFSIVEENLIKAMAADLAFFVDKKQSPKLRKEVSDSFTHNFPNDHPYYAYGLTHDVDYFFWNGPTEKYIGKINELFSSNRMVSLLRFQALTKPDTRLCELQSYYLEASLRSYQDRKEFEIVRRGYNALQSINFECSEPKNSLSSLLSYAWVELAHGDVNRALDLYKRALNNPYLYDKDCTADEGDSCQGYVHMQLTAVFGRLGLSTEREQEINQVRSLCALQESKCSVAKTTLKKIFFPSEYSQIDEEKRLIKLIDDNPDDISQYVYLNYLSTFYTYTNKNLEKAILYKKSAVKFSYKAYLRLIEEDKKSGRFFKSDFDRWYQNELRDLAELLILDSRLDEADKILPIIKESEGIEFTRGNEDKVKQLSEVKLNKLEEEFFTKFSKAKINRAELINSINNQIDLVSSRKDIDKKPRDTKIAKDHPILKLDNSVLIRYITLKDKTYIIINTATSQDYKIINISEKDLNAKIFTVRNLLSDSKSSPKQKLNELYELLFKPIEEFLGQDKKPNILLSLDKNLRYLPFSALYDGNYYLVEKYNTALYLDSAKDKLLSKRHTYSSGVAYGVSKKVKNFEYLPFVSEEINNLIKTKDNNGLIPGKIFLNDSFNLDSLNELKNNTYPIVHFSSHFVFSAGSEENSFLLLGDGTQLSLKEIRDKKLNFRKTNLVTLSACDTARGGGKDENGSEIDGFSDLVLKGGAESVMSSLWKVADKSTTELINQFYKNYFELGLTKGDSLQKAQLNLLKESYLFSHPYFWAPFILIGNTF